MEVYSKYSILLLSNVPSNEMVFADTKIPRCLNPWILEFLKPATLHASEWSPGHFKGNLQFSVKI